MVDRSPLPVSAWWPKVGAGEPFGPQGTGPWLLVTSVWHIPRAMADFEAAVDSAIHAGGACLHAAARAPQNRTHLRSTATLHSKGMVST
jgi:hypothetical protein